ncbi:hypothetical protein BDF20DRAFT_831862 [Mycotypha africana]|uniref:uncharacterized protein n=1 Tax=Mycotypha africana TaxID=64632 RepID=UPI002300AC23|nr:uncharacterized protein BDF20DRAFT_831862 [Mycotypha africana]KAI8991858.1 hypothetical protein BDF20DRAFT_831862 [Mycotypha africana]
MALLQWPLMRYYVEDTKPICVLILFHRYQFAAYASPILKLSMQFFYEDGQGHVVDVHGVEPMDLVVDEELYAIDTISSRTQFLMNKPPERPSNPVILPVADEINYHIDMELCNKRRYTVYSDEDKTRFFIIFQQMLECFCCCETIGHSYPGSAEMG